MVDWLKRNRWTVGIIIACMFLTAIALGYKQQVDKNTEQGVQLEQLVAQQNQEVVLEIADNAYNACVTNNAYRKIIKDALQGLGTVAEQVPLSNFDGTDPIDREALAKALTAVDQLEDRECPPDPTP